MDFHYIKTLHCALSRPEAIARVQETITKDKTLCIAQWNVTSDELSFALKQPFGLVYNSFLPHVRVTFREIASGTELTICCRLQKTTRVIQLVYLLLGAAMELGMVVTCLIAKASSPALLVLPGILAFSVILSYFGLRLSSRDILQQITSAVQLDTRKSQ